MVSPRIRIDGGLKSASENNIVLGVVLASVKVAKHDEELWKEINTCISELASVLVQEIPMLKEVKALRTTYKALGKDPSRYRGSNEALLRRIREDKGLYKVNTIVDINNLTSLESRRSVASYDRKKLGDNILFRRGLKGETYEAIGKGTMNVEGLPVFVDGHGPFGSSTSDSQRAMITADTTELLMVIISFDGEQGLDSQLTRATSLLEKYAQARDVWSAMVK